MNKEFAVIFDWDGVVIDSSTQHEESWELLAAELGLSLPAGHFQRGFGKKNEVIIPELGWATASGEVKRLADRKEEIYRKLVARDGVKILPGARELLENLRAVGIPRSVGSSTPRKNLEALFAVTDLDRLFDQVVSGDDVTLGKPDPAVFLLAAERMKISSERCVVIEDALSGIEAARRARMAVVGVATTNPLELLSHCDLALPSLQDLSVASLAGLIP